MIDKAFITDLDGTVIYSHRRVGDTRNMTCIENQPKYQSYINTHLYKNLAQWNDIVPFIPLTTRSEEEYKRIRFPFVPQYALVGNGAVLLRNGERVVEWEQETKKLIENEYQVLRAIEAKLAECLDLYNIQTLRIVENSFLFVKTDEAEQLDCYIKRSFDMTNLTLYRHNNKISIVPTQLEKGIAARRLRKYLDIKTIVSAGDTDMDTSMLEYADKTIECDVLKDKGEYMDE
jgi:hydroxymethylpyrimidine pyrophosphatase-like HAD family hydrolase